MLGAMNTRSPELQKISKDFAKMLRGPAEFAVMAVPGIKEKDKKAFLADPIGLLFDVVQGSADVVRRLIDRVTERSGKHEQVRKVGNIKVDMRTSKNDPLAKTVAQLLTILGTAWYATHEELLRMATGQPVGKRGPLGSLGEPATATAATGGALAVVAELTAVGSAATGGLAVVVGPLLTLGGQAADIAKKFDKPKTEEKKAADLPVAAQQLTTSSRMAVPTPPAVLPKKADNTMLYVGGALALGLVLVLVLRK